MSSLFIGRFDYKLDAKNRVSIPAGWDIEDGCTLLLRGSKRNNMPMIRALTLEQFRESIQTVKDSSLTSAQKSLLIGKLHSDCVETVINSQRKMLLPKRMVELGGFNVDVTLVGREGCFEIWKPELFEESERLLEGVYEELDADIGVL